MPLIPPLRNADLDICEQNRNELERIGPRIPAVHVANWRFWNSVVNKTTSSLAPMPARRYAQIAAEDAMGASGSYQPPFLYFYLGHVWAYTNKELEEERQAAIGQGCLNPIVGVAIVFSEEVYERWPACFTHFDTGAIFPRSATRGPYIEINYSPDLYVQESLLDASQWRETFYSFVSYYFEKPWHYFDDKFKPSKPDPDGLFTSGNWRGWAWELKYCGSAVDIELSTIPYLPDPAQRMMLESDIRFAQMVADTKYSFNSASAYRRYLRDEMKSLLQ